MHGRLFQCAFCRFCRHATPPRHEPADLHHQKPTHMREAARWYACTIPAEVGRVVPWPVRNPPEPTGSSEKPGPTPHTRDIPTCRASRSHRRCTSATILCFVHCGARWEEEDCPCRHPATAGSHSDKTVWTTASRQNPAA